MKIGIMQPYFFPYFGYFQLINAVDVFVFYDDVNYIKKGWINRNRFLVNGQENLITIPCVSVSQNKLIKNIEIDFQSPKFDKALKTFHQAYRNAPNYSDVAEIFTGALKSHPKSISELSIKGITLVCEYLGMSTRFKVSSEQNYQNQSLKKDDRLIDIVKRENGFDYINSIGGVMIYDKNYFKERGISLHFLKTHSLEYLQYGKPCVKDLSIIDVLMFANKEYIINSLSLTTLL